jgi:hypothetical protein
MYVDSLAAGDPSTRAPLRLNVPEGVKSLKEVRGYVGADVLTPLVPVITMDNILDAPGKSVEGKTGGTFNVSEVQCDDKGQVTIKVAVEKPLPVPVGVFRGRGFRRRGIAVEERSNDPSVLGRTISLVDEKGQAFKLTGVDEKLLEAPGAVEYQLTFQPPDGAAKAAKLVYLGRLRTTIDVPFVLKDVPAP